ncbi:hypothetical protein [Streptomyces fuscigenes]|uniref:hypothetical protein n=1 Tax=Streptomyces fuscigenes TaxID=1528880 RepID=UPI001F3383C3|nr:hypothetical protein [Streptomyces fuscigenes]MCF3962405.1 hypothetical protein [Streptomyces fuscigenes]
MSHKQALIICILLMIFAWSAAMTALGQFQAAAAMLPSLGLLVQQVVAAFNGTQARRGTAEEPAPAAPGGTQPPEDPR